MDGQCMLDWKLLLEYLRVFLSGPVVGGLVATLFVILFRKDISALMQRIVTFKGAGVELTTTQQVRSLEAALAPTTSPPSSAEPAETPQGLHLPPEELKRLQDFIRTERDRATLWEYRFLNFFLVARTQLVLDWIAREPNGRTTIKMFDAVWRQDIPDLQERVAILNALREHTLVNIQGDLVELTAKGREYLGWRGAFRSPLPPPQPAAAAPASASPPASD
jgi:hypothetical protein